MSCEMEIDVNVKRLGLERSEEIAELVQEYLKGIQVTLPKTARLQVKGIRLEFLVDDKDTIFFEQGL